MNTHTHTHTHTRGRESGVSCKGNSLIWAFLHSTMSCVPPCMITADSVDVNFVSLSLVVTRSEFFMWKCERMWSAVLAIVGFSPFAEMCAVRSLTPHDDFLGESL